MTDTDPRLEAVAEAIEAAGMAGPNNPPWWAGIITAAYDALCAFGQVQPAKIALTFLAEIAEECDPADPEWADPAAGRRSIWEITSRAIRALSSPPQPESEVMPHFGPESSALEHNASAPVMGADPPWLLDEPTIREIFAQELERHSEAALARAVRDGSSNSRGVIAAISAIRKVIAFANAQPPSQREVEAAAAAHFNRLSTRLWSEIAEDEREYFREIARPMLIIVAKARAGA